jgi:hypothetical protein
MTAGSTQPGVFWSCGTVALNAPYRIAGFIEYANGLATPGTFSTAPTAVRLFGPGVVLPGNCVQQSIVAYTSGNQNFTLSTVNATVFTSVPNFSTVFTPAFPASVIQCQLEATGMAVSLSGPTGGVGILKATTASAQVQATSQVGNIAHVRGATSGSATTVVGAVSIMGYDSLWTTTVATTYAVYLGANGGVTLTFPYEALGTTAGPSPTATLAISELMG